MVQSYKRRVEPRTERRRRSGKTSYGHRRWRKLSEAFLRMYPFCIHCLCNGELNQGAEQHALDTQRNLVVDHIQLHNEDQSLFWDQENWETLCRFPCHDATKQRIDKTSGDWWSYLQRIIRDKGTRSFIEEHREWIPEHVWEKLNVRS